MKKQTFLHKLTNWLAALGFAAVCGCMAVVNNQVQKTDAYTVQKAQESVTFSVAELNNCTYPYLYFNYQQHNYLDNSYVVYNGERYNYEEVNANGIAVYDWIEFNLNTGKWDNGDTFEYSLTIYSTYFAENMQKSITLSASQLNNNTYEYFANQLNELSSDTELQNSYIIYNNQVCNLVTFEANSNLSYKIAEDINIQIFLEESNEYYAKWYINDNIEGELLPFNNSITIYSTYIADNINAPFTDGDDIIGGITSGLGLISYLATTFLNGFTGLFWQNNALTNFAMYSLIMLGITITFSIIKLVLNILRSNTGA